MPSISLTRLHIALFVSFPPRRPSSAFSSPGKESPWIPLLALLFPEPKLDLLDAHSLGQTRKHAPLYDVRSSQKGHAYHLMKWCDEASSAAHWMVSEETALPSWEDADTVGCARSATSPR